MDQINMPEKEQQFTFAHFAIVGVCALSLASLAFMKSGFRLGSESELTSSSGQANLTYEAARKSAEERIKSQSGNLAEEENPLAILDPSYSSGQVAGTNTDSIVPSADQLFPDSELDKIEIKIFSENSLEAVKFYANKAAGIESKYNSLQMLSDVTSNDKTILENVAANSQKVISELKAIEVPLVLAKYHKLKMVFFTTIRFMAESKTGVRPELDANELGTSFLSLMEKIEIIKSEIYTQYKIELL